MPTVLLTHTPDMLANYYGERPLAALRALCDVRLNDTGGILDTPAKLAKAAAGCAIIISDRQTPGPAEFVAQAPAELFPVELKLVVLRERVKVRRTSERSDKPSSEPRHA